jgi:hypothetical protein
MEPGVAAEPSGDAPGASYGCVWRRSCIAKGAALDGATRGDPVVRSADDDLPAFTPQVVNAAYAGVAVDGERAGFGPFARHLEGAW